MVAARRQDLLGKANCLCGHLTVDVNSFQIVILMVLCNQYHMDPAVSFTDCFDMLQYIIEILHNFSELLIISIIALAVLV